MMSKALLLKNAREHDYKPEILEKVYQLLQTLEQFMAVPFLRDRLVLKGGTALNLFYFEHIPRLSVDVEIPVLDLHELAAGKLSALFSRDASRDLFDAHHLLVKQTLDYNKLRVAFTIYLAMTNIDLAELRPEAITYNVTDIRNRLLPVLRQQEFPRNPSALKKHVITMVGELKEAMSNFLPLSDHEREFISQVREHGNIRPELIVDEGDLFDHILHHPAIKWRAQKAIGA